MVSSKPDVSIVHLSESILRCKNRLVVRAAIEGNDTTLAESHELSRPQRG